jgi:tetratricopeptide (TPR) repeat protein
MAAAASQSDPANTGRWLRESRAEAQRWLPQLLDLPEASLGEALARHPELQPGISQLLLDVATLAVDRDRNRACELTAAVIGQVGLNVPSPHGWMTPHLRGQAWTAHAGALLGLDRYVEALAAIGAAFDAYQTAHMNAFYIAEAEVVEARILHELGERVEALRLIRRAAEVILLHGAAERYVQIRAQECGMLGKAGDAKAAARVWAEVARVAYARRDPELTAVVERRKGVNQLDHGQVAEAAHSFSTAYGLFEKLGRPREAARALRGLATAESRRGRLHAAISEYHKAQGLLLAHGEIFEAAEVSTEILKLLLMTGRQHEAIPLADLFIRTFEERGLESGMQAWTLVRDSAREGKLTYHLVGSLRQFFRNLPLRPNARFE